MRNALLLLCFLCVFSTAAHGNEQKIQLIVLTDAHSSAQELNLNDAAAALIKGFQDSPGATNGGLAWIAISKEASTLLPFTQVSDLKSKTVEDASRSYSAVADRRGLNPVLTRAVQELGNHEGHRAIVVFLADKLSGESALDSELSRQMADKKITVHAIGLGSQPNKSMVRQLADESDGVHYGIERSITASAAVPLILDNLDRGRRGRPMLQRVASVQGNPLSPSGEKRSGMGFWGWLFVLSWGVVAIVVLFRFYRMAGQQQSYAQSDPDELDNTQTDRSFSPDEYFESGGDSDAVQGITQFRFVPLDANFPAFESSGDGRDITVGRRKASDIFLDHPGCSGKHALVRWSDGQLRVVDRGSTNGTFVNDKRVGDQAVNTGDIVRFDSIGYRVEAVAAAGNDGGDEHSQAGTMMLAADDPELKRMIEQSQSEEAAREQVDLQPEAPSIELHHAHCLRHTNRLASGHCAECNRPYCPDCLEYVLDREVCVRCRKHDVQ